MDSAVFCGLQCTVVKPWPQVEGSLTDTMHILFAVMTIALMLLIIGFGAAALGKRFRLFSIICIIIFIVFGVLIGLDSPGVSTNLPTPRLGIWQRINIGIFLIWIVVFAMMLLRKEGISRSHESLAD
jgi:amino acid transporter